MNEMKQLQSDLKRILDEDEQRSEIEIERTLIEKVLSEFAALERKSMRILYLEAKTSRLENKIKEDAEKIEKANKMVGDSLVVEDKLKKEASGVKKQKSQLEKKIKEKDRAIKEADATIVKQREQISGLSNRNSELELHLKKREEELKSSKEQVMQMQDNIVKAMEETILDLENKLAVKEDVIKEKLKSEMLKLMDKDAKQFQDRVQRALKTKVEELKSSNDDMFQLMDEAKQQEDHRLGQALQDLETTLTSTEKKLKSLKKEMKIKLMDAKETEVTKMLVYRNKVLNSVMELEKLIKDHEDKNGLLVDSLSSGSGN